MAYDSYSSLICPWKPQEKGYNAKYVLYKLYHSN